MTNVYLGRKRGAKYPKKNTLFRPHISYPEYIFSEDISNENNDVYELIREGFHSLRLDEDNYGSKSWNPLKEKIHEGDTVLIKPNMVLHHNLSECGEECLYTHPSLVAVMIDYVLIALGEKGKIIVGDAPLQECDFNVLINESGYKDLIEYYQQKGIDIELVDFRNVKTFEEDGLHYMQEKEGHGGIIVQLNENSAFYGMSDEQIKSLRITNYDPRVLQKHHDSYLHEYNVSKYVLDADVIINMPKPKTHRKAGVTISLKNLVGINANKEFLPHHMLGSREEGGDAYGKANYYLEKANKVLDLKNELINEKDVESAKIAENLYIALYNKGIEYNGEKYWEGSWHGNNTIWKTITDLNRILLYADKTGIIKEEKQRKIFIVGDMLVSGQKEGPLEPVPIYPGVIAMGEDPVYFDRAVCSIMGFDYKLIPSLYSKEILNAKCPITDESDYRIISSEESWNNRSFEEICDKYSLEFQPTYGWAEKLGNKYLEHMVDNLKGEKVYVFGAGINGRYAADILLRKGVKIAGFLDNNEELWGREIYNNLTCFEPKSTCKGNIIVGGVKEKHIKDIEAEILEYGGVYGGTINR